VGTEEDASCFQNVDLDLTFGGDITPLILGFGSALTELHRREEYWRLVRALPAGAPAAWNICRRRTMNVGVQAPVGHSVELAVSRESIERLHEIGAELLFTVYRGEG